MTQVLCLETCYLEFLDSSPISPSPIYIMKASQGEGEIEVMLCNIMVPEKESRKSVGKELVESLLQVLILFLFSIVNYKMDIHGLPSTFYC